MNDFEKLLASAVSDCEQKGRDNKSFLEKAHRIYNSFAVMPCPLINAEHPYLLGVVFAAFAKYYIKDVNIYASISENACYCFSKVLKDGNSQSERQCAAIKLLLFMDENYPLMLQMAKNFRNYKCEALYGQPAMMVNMIAQGMDKYAYEEDLLKNIGSYCKEVQESTNLSVSISAQEMRLFEKICTSQRFSLEWPLVSVPAFQVFELFYEFICKIISTPFERRITVLPFGNRIW